ncbi:MAG: GNAT family N-acetyltransferase [Oscillospiraceae bacterium]|nr:GNAT family N-acetyltransferase [Oscillospiraceae bacterium]
MKTRKLRAKINKLTAAEFIELWESVWENAPSEEQTALALEHSIFRISVYDGEEPVAMARMIGDFGLDYYIKDVVVKPEYQKKGIGRMMMKECIKFIRKNGVSGTDIYVELCAMPDVMPFYEKFGFSSNEAQRMKRMCRIIPETEE